MEYVFLQHFDYYNIVKIQIQIDEATKWRVKQSFSQVTDDFPEFTFSCLLFSVEVRMRSQK